MNEQPPATINGVAGEPLHARLTKAQILAADDRKRVDIDVPQWGGMITLRELSLEQRNTLSRTYQEHKGDGVAVQTQALSEAIMLASIVDERGDPLFTADDLPALRQRSAIATDRITAAALELNGMQAGANADKEKNS